MPEPARSGATEKPLEQGNWHLFEQKVAATFLEVRTEVYSAADIAAAAGVRTRDVWSLVATGVVEPIHGRYFAEREAIRAVRCLCGRNSPERTTFRRDAGIRHRRAVPLSLSAAVHGAAALLLVAGLGTAGPHRPRATRSEDATLVFLVSPSRAGGGGGQDAAHSSAALQARALTGIGMAALTPAAAIRRPPLPPIERPQAPPIVEPPLAAPAAPIILLAADMSSRIGTGVAAAVSALPVASRWPGAGEGIGGGQGTGIGDGAGPGVSDGSDDGAGGGPYHAGSDVSPPSIVREVKPDYTEEGRRRGLEGEVNVEVIVRRDGSVGAVKLLDGLGAGLDQRAIEAVRQWRFAPAQRHGLPVDVVVDIAVGFHLR
ncbi:MAG: energy transducer TonB [Vicinamibacterales bacterium]